MRDLLHENIGKDVTVWLRRDSNRYAGVVLEVADSLVYFAGDRETGFVCVIGDIVAISFPVPTETDADTP